MRKRRCPQCRREKMPHMFRGERICTRCTGTLHGTVAPQPASALDPAVPARSVDVALHADRMLKVQLLDSLVIVSSGRRLGRGRGAALHVSSTISLPRDRLRALVGALRKL